MLITIIHNNMSAKSKKVIKLVLTILLVFAFTSSGVTKLLGAEMQLKNLESWGYPLWLRFPIGLSEIGLAIGLLLPKFRKLTIYSIFGWAVVAIFTHLQAGQTNMIVTPILFGVIAFALFFLLKVETKN